MRGKSRTTALGLYHLRLFLPFFAQNGPRDVARPDVLGVTRAMLCIRQPVKLLGRDGHTEYLCLPCVMYISLPSINIGCKRSPY